MNDRSKNSLAAFVWSITANLRFAAAIFFLLLSLLNTVILLRSSHNAVCGLVETKLSSLVGPLGRELALSESDISTAIFGDFKKTLQELGANETLSLERTSSEVPFEGRMCRPQLLTASVYFPIHFAGETVGVISGSVTYFSIKTLLLCLATTLLIVLLGFKLLTSKLTKQLSKNLVEPIRKLSRNESLCHESELPAEVVEVKNNIERLKTDIQEKERQNFSLLKSQELAEMAAQVAHDIRSPVTALNLVAQELTGVPEQQRVLLRSAVATIGDIANTLVKKSYFSGELGDYRSDEFQVPDEPIRSPQLLSSVIETIVSEKRLQYRSKLGLDIAASIDTNSYGVFAKVHPLEFKRVLSNLINNSVEATGDRGRIEVCLCGEGDYVKVLVRDNGKGIPERILPRIMEKGFTFGKQNGSGLGLYHAKQTVETWGGQIHVQSRDLAGATITISLQKDTPPRWFVPELKIPYNSDVVILDDDLSIHQIWQKRFEQIGGAEQRIRIHDFSTIEEIMDWRKANETMKTSVLYLVDYELIGQGKNGLEVIDALEIEDDAILVTSRFEEPRVVQRCLENGVRMIPKSLAACVPIYIEGKAHAPVQPDCVLIDDQKIVHLTWKTAAQLAGKNLKSFRSADRFFKCALHLSRQVPVYIDSNLGNEIRGEYVAKEIRSLGFHKVILTTGSKPDRFRTMPWLSDVVDKDPPWRSNESQR